MVNFFPKMTVDWTEEEYEEEAKRLDWSIEFLKAHIRKEERIKKVFEQIKEL